MVGIAGACLVAASFAVLSSFALSDARLADVVKKAFARDEFSYAARIYEDFFTECALLEMQHLRRGNIFRSALDTRFLMREGEHPCDSLRALVLGSPEEKTALPAAVSYFNYPFGSRHLEAFVLSALDYGQAAFAYSVLSYASPALLFLVMLRRAPGTAILLAPLPLALIGAFSMHRLGGNLAHAPGYFIGFLALAVFLGKPRSFEGISARLGFAGVLGVIAAYFDILDGQIPTLLSLTILLNHFFYVTAARERQDYLLRAATQGVAIFACFVAAYLMVTLSRLGLLWLNGVDVSPFMSSLTARSADDIGIKISFGMNLNALFAARHQLTPGGTGPANWVFLAGIAGWIFAGLVGAATLVFRRALRGPPLVDIMVLAAVSLGILAWYWLFVSHTYVHVLLMVRLLAIPLACGMVAVILAIREARRDRLPAAAVILSLCVAAILAALILHKRWMIGLSASAVEARSVDARVDLVSCSPLGLRSDGQPDGVIEIRFRKGAPPLGSLGLPSNDQAKIQLLRRDPVGVYHTGFINNILGITKAPGGTLLNGRNGIFSFAAGGEQHVYGHFCRDGHDKPSSTYEVKVDDVTVPLLLR